MLGWTAQALADQACVGVATVRRYEAGSQVAETSLSAIEAALVEAGITFIASGEASRTGGEGVRLSPTSKR